MPSERRESGGKNEDQGKTRPQEPPGKDTGSGAHQPLLSNIHLHFSARKLCWSRISGKLPVRPSGVLPAGQLSPRVTAIGPSGGSRLAESGSRSSTFLFPPTGMLLALMNCHYAGAVETSGAHRRRNRHESLG